VGENGLVPEVLICPRGLEWYYLW